MGGILPSRKAHLNKVLPYLTGRVCPEVARKATRCPALLYSATIEGCPTSPSPGWVLKEMGKSRESFPSLVILSVQMLSVTVTWLLGEVSCEGTEPCAYPGGSSVS